MTEYETKPRGNTRYRDELGRFRRPRYKPVDPLLTMIALDFAQKAGDVLLAELVFPAERKERPACDSRADFESLSRELMRGAKSADDPPAGVISFLPQNRRRSPHAVFVDE